MFQPILDLLTSFSIYVHMSATVGIVVRFACMLLALGYLLLHHKQQGAKKYILYLCLFGIVLAIGLVNNLMVKSPVSFGEEVKFIMKSVYPIVLLFGYIIALKELKITNMLFIKSLRIFYMQH